MKFEVINKGLREIYPVYLAGFHDSRFLSGEVFLNKQQANSYCDGKAIYVKEIAFYSREKAEDFVNQMARCFVNQCRFVFDAHVNINEIGCDQFKKEVENILNE